MPVLGFAHYNLRASRALLDELRDFYCDVVGLAVGQRPPFQSFGYWLYAGECDVLHLVETAPGEVRMLGNTTTFDHAAFRCTDRGAFEQKLRQHGVPFEIAHVPATDQVQLFLKDPAGNGVELNFADEKL